MTTKKAAPDAHTAVAHKPGPEVDAFMAALAHPDQAAIAELRRLILEADPRIHEGIKWNAPSFHYRDWFATVHLRAKDGLQLIFHLGAKAKQQDARAAALPAAAGLNLQWLAKDRCLLKFANLDELRGHQEPLREFVRQWLVLL